MFCFVEEKLDTEGLNEPSVLFVEEKLDSKGLNRTACFVCRREEVGCGGS